MLRFPFRVAIAVILITVFAVTVSFAADTVEFLNGSKARGTVKTIRKADKEFDFGTKVGNRTFMRTYPFSKVHAVTMKGKRYELTPKPLPDASNENVTGKPATRSKAGVKAVIAAAGSTPPDWFDSTPLDYPKTLDLSWPLKPPTEGWHSQKNMGQYIWSVINENPSRWHSGVKLVHHCMTLHDDEKSLLRRDMQTLGTMYFTLLQDYPRAAFWFQKANVTVRQGSGIRLAECYWRLGNRGLALDMMRDKRLPVSAIKLYGDMGDLRRALQITRAFGKTRVNNQAYILAGDALRQAGKLDLAIKYYQRVVDADNFRNKDYEKRFKARARESIDAIRLFDQVDVGKIADGSYRDNSTGYAGQIMVEVTVASGRLEAVRITDHKEKQFYSALTDTPAQLIAKQSVQGIDATSGATITSLAIINATAKALAQGAEKE